MKEKKEKKWEKKEKKMEMKKINKRRRWENKNNGDGDDGDIYMRTRTIEMGTMQRMGEQEQWRWGRWGYLYENQNN